MQKRKAFTLVEILVVISIISLLMAILMPSLSAAKAQALALVCKTNLRQLVLANIGYSTEFDGFYVPAAEDMWNHSGLKRWHGKRANIDEAFDATQGPLAGYLGDGEVKECPMNVRFKDGEEWSVNFERGCGGYGYNMTYIGSRLWQANIGFKEAYAKTTNASEICRPADTIMFADTAMSNDGENFIEYSFAEPPFTVYGGQPITYFYMSPSIHFRHRKSANVGWADGHVSSCKKAEFENINNVYGADSEKMELGWPEKIDNSLFDLK